MNDSNCNAFQHLKWTQNLRKVYLLLTSKENGSQLKQQLGKRSCRMSTIFWAITEDYAELVDNVLKAYQLMGTRMSLKMHFLHSHLDFYPHWTWSMSATSMRKDIIVMEKRYQGKCNPSMMADYSLLLQRETDVQHERKSKGLKHFRACLFYFELNWQQYAVVCFQNNKHITNILVGNSSRHCVGIFTLMFKRIKSSVTCISETLTSSSNWISYQKSVQQLRAKELLWGSQ